MLASQGMNGLTNNRARIALIPALCVAGILVVGATGVPEADVRDEVRIAALRGPTAVGVAGYLADGGELSTRGRPVRVELLADPPTMVARLASGEVDVGMVPTNLAAQLYARGVPITIEAITLWGVLYVVGPASLAGDEVAVAASQIAAFGRGATPDVALRHLLSEFAPEGELSIEYLTGQVELAQLVAAGERDVAILPEPFVTQVLEARPDLAVVFDLQSAWRARYGASYPQTAIVARTDISDDALAAALELIERGWSSAIADPEQADRDVVAAGVGFPPGAVAASLPRLNARYAPIATVRDAVERYLAVLAEANPAAVGGAMPSDGLYGR